MKFTKYDIEKWIVFFNTQVDMQTFLSTGVDIKFKDEDSKTSFITLASNQRGAALKIIETLSKALETDDYDVQLDDSGIKMFIGVFNKQMALLKKLKPDLLDDTFNEVLSILKDSNPSDDTDDDNTDVDSASAASSVESSADHHSVVAGIFRHRYAGSRLRKSDQIARRELSDQARREHLLSSRSASSTNSTPPSLPTSRLKYSSGQPANDDVTPLYIAAQNGSVEVVKKLLSEGADVNKVGKDGTTPINIAIECGNTEVVKALLDHYADIDCELPNVKDLISIAMKKGYTEICSLLQTRNPSISSAFKSP